MPKIIPSHELDQIVELIAKHPNGIGVEGLLQALGASMKRRTLQRRLSTLADQKQIITEGEGRALKYLLAPIIAKADIVQESATAQATGEVYVPTSSEGEAIKNYVRQPRQQRQPVSYKIEFLEQYQPNQTFYLPEALRAQLHALGRSSAEQAPAGTFARDILNRLFY